MKAEEKKGMPISTLAPRILLIITCNYVNYMRQWYILMMYDALTDIQIQIWYISTHEGILNLTWQYPTSCTFFRAYTWYRSDLCLLRGEKKQTRSLETCCVNPALETTTRLTQHEAVSVRQKCKCTRKSCVPTDFIEGHPKKIQCGHDCVCMCVRSQWIL